MAIGRYLVLVCSLVLLLFLPVVNECLRDTGADGAYSAVRQSMMRVDRFNYSQEYLDHGFKELRMPPAAECGVDPSLWDGFAVSGHFASGFSNDTIDSYQNLI